MGLLKVTKSIILLLIVITGLFTACSNAPAQTGTLQGTVHIGPIWPVERPGYNPPVPPEVFAARKVMIYNKQRTKLITEVALKQIEQEPNASYSVQLKPGIYIVDINHTGMDRSPDVPKEIEIKAGEITEVNIDIDTGIR